MINIEDHIWYCNDANCWRDEMTEDEIKTCCLKGECSKYCEVASEFQSKEEKTNNSLSKQ